MIQGRIAIDQAVRILEGKHYLKHVGPKIYVIDKTTSTRSIMLRRSRRKTGNRFSMSIEAGYLTHQWSRRQRHWRQQTSVGAANAPTPVAAGHRPSHAFSRRASRSIASISSFGFRRGPCPVRREWRRQIDTDPNLAGVHRPTAGGLLFSGQPVELRAVHHARTLGISAVFQEFSLVPMLTVEENLFLGAEVTGQASLTSVELHRRAEDILERLGFPLRARPAGPISLARRAADGGDREGVPHRSLGSDPG